MKHILFLSFILWGLCACSDDESSFEVTIPREALSFSPIAGGAVMHYTLPRDKDILSIRVRYEDARGQEILRAGSYANDTVSLIGFNEAQSGIKARVSLCSRAGEESEPVEVTFDTKDSGPVAFFRQLEVKPSWNGFMLSYDVPERANGMAHVFYVWENPTTKESDTLLMSSFPITEGADTLAFALKHSGPTNDVVIRTEDFRGYIVKEQTWKGVEAYNTVKLEPSEFEFEDTDKVCVEDEEYYIGHRYLFDGDTKGEIAFLSEKKVYAGLFGPSTVGNALGVIHFKEPKKVGSIRLYATLYVKRTWPTSDEKYGRILRSGGYVGDMLPCKLTVYVSNDNQNWKKMAFHEEYQEYGIGAWGYPATSTYLNSLKAVQEAEPVYLELTCPATGEEFSHVKVVIDDMFLYPDSWYYSASYRNSDQYMLLQELEIYTAKD